jgi:hypothetical protein
MIDLLVDPYPVVYGNLNLKGSDHMLSWMAQRPFRPSDLLLWGTDSTTYVRSFTIGLSEQIAQPFPFHLVLRAPWFPVESLSGPWQDGLHNPGELRDLLDGVRLTGILKVRVNPILTFETASPGVRMRLHITGALQHAIVYGHSVD